LATGAAAVPIVGAMHRSRWPAVLAALTLALADGGCSYPPQIKRTLVPPETPGTLDRKAPYLKAHLRDGGVYLLARWTVDEALKVPVIGLPIVSHDNNQHASNENARLQNLWDGIETYAGLMADLRW
jgi:hypothetical protein